MFVKDDNDDENECCYDDNDYRRGEGDEVCGAGDDDNNW